METNKETEQLLSVLRRRYTELEQAYQNLEQYTRSLETEQQSLQKQFSTLQTEMRQWQASQGVRLGRTLGQFSRNLKQNLTLTAGLINAAFNHSIEAYLDEPQPNIIISGELVISGWATSHSPETMRIEIRLNDSLLGQADYHLERLDVVEVRPWQPQTDCGFAARFKLDRNQFISGSAILSISFSDSHSPDYTLTCPVIIAPVEPPQDQKLYIDWMARTQMKDWDFLQQQAICQKWNYQPTISLLLNLDVETRPDLLAELLDSVLAQTYSYWEVVLHLPDQASADLQEIVDLYVTQDNRVQLVVAATEGLNSLLEFANGEFITLPEADALLSNDALFQAVHLLKNQLDAVLLYSDEDYLNEVRERSQPQFKPDWSPALFYARPYIGQLTLYRVSAIRVVGGFKPEFEKAQCYELILRLLERFTSIYHLPQVVYHSRHLLDLNRPLETPFQQALETHFQRDRKVTTIAPGLLPGSFHCQFHLETTPSISLIIPTRDQSEVLRRCLDSVIRLTSYPNYEIVVVDNASHQMETRRYLAELSTYPRVRQLVFDGPFNYSAINNFAVNQSKSELLVFLNNDTEVITPTWLEEMASYAIQPKIGAVGARLLYPNGTIQHAGVIVGILGIADHILKGLPATLPGYLGLAKTVKNMSALTAACLMTRRELFLELGGFDEQHLPVAFNDVDYCLKLREKELELVWTPYAELYHHEALSRGADLSIEKENRLHQEIIYMFEHWSEAIANDPYYNPNLSRDRLDYVVTSRLSQPKIIFPSRDEI